MKRDTLLIALSFPALKHWYRPTPLSPNNTALVAKRNTFSFVYNKFQSRSSH